MDVRSGESCFNFLLFLKMGNIRACMYADIGGALESCWGRERAQKQKSSFWLARGGVRWGGKLASDGKKTENKDPKQGRFIDLVRRGWRVSVW